MQPKQALIEKWTSTGFISDKRLIDAFMQVAREDFVQKQSMEEAYADYALPILEGQTISQPSTVMFMIQEAELRKEHKVLEVGAGSGYNAALISKLVKEVITTEIVPELAEYAEKNLMRAGINNVRVVQADGSMGFAEGAPYDRIIITAASPQIPRALMDQLKEGGIIIAPVGPTYTQKMLKAVKEKGGVRIKELGDFMFVPLKGEQGYDIS